MPLQKLKCAESMKVVMQNDKGLRKLKIRALHPIHLYINGLERQSQLPTQATNNSPARYCFRNVKLHLFWGGRQCAPPARAKHYVK